MSAEKLEPGLYVVATPIGAARDITLRALDILGAADVIAAEDTRTARRLMDIHGVALGGRRLVAYHDHNAQGMREALLDALRDGKSVACVSEAGTPLVSDPGFDIVRAAAAEDLPVFAAPGASAALAALTVSGLPADRFMFAGFAPQKSAARARWLAELADTQATLILYESPRRIAAALAQMAEAFGETRPAALCRELTKMHEEVLRAPLGVLRDDIASRSKVQGEIVMVIGPAEAQTASDADAATLLRAELADRSVKDAVRSVAEVTGLPRKAVYALALEISRELEEN